MQKTLACVALFVLALGMAPAQTEARWTGNVMVVNLMQNYSLEFLVSARALFSSVFPTSSLFAAWRFMNSKLFMLCDLTTEPARIR